LGGNDANDIRFRHDLLLRRVDQSPGSSRLIAQFLNRLHDLDGLNEECFADLLGPRQVLVEPQQNLGKVRERLHAFVPAAVFDLRAIVGGVAELSGGEDDVRWNRGRGQEQRDEGVRIKCDRREQLLQLLKREPGQGVVGLGQRHLPRAGLGRRRQTSQNRDDKR